MRESLPAFVEGIGLLGPGLDGWEAAMPILIGKSVFCEVETRLPVPQSLPPAERRRVGLVIKLALAVGRQATAAANVDPADLPAVFSSSGGDGQNCHEICQTLSTGEGQISPTRFHNSVHNAAAGYWSIATGAKTASNALCAYDFSFTAGLLEAMAQVVADQTRVLLVAYDAQYPAPLHEIRPIRAAFGVAMVLAHEQSPRAMARLDLSFSDSPPTRMANSNLELLRASIPAARVLPLLQSLARRERAHINVEYLDGGSLAIQVTPCN